MRESGKKISANIDQDAGEIAALAAHNSRKSSREQVFDAILDLSDGEIPAKAPDIARVTGFGMPIVYDSIKALKQRGRIYSENGAFFVCHEYAETQSVSHTALENGLIKLEKGDQIMELNPREVRNLAKTLSGTIEQAAVIVMHHRQNEQQAQMRRMQRQMQKMQDALAQFIPPAQMQLLERG